jgi:hypothetical protein
MDCLGLPLSWVEFDNVDAGDSGMECTLANQPDSNQVNLETDGASCSDFPTEDCLPGPPAGLYGLIVECGGIPDETAVEVDFRDGCPTKLVTTISDSWWQSRLDDCMVPKLTGKRFQCAVGADCIGYLYTTLR